MQIEDKSTTEDECKHKKIEIKSNLNEITSLLINFFKQFLKFYGLRATLSLVPLIFKLFKGKLPRLEQITNILFNKNNLRTGLFLSLMPSIYHGLNNLFENLSSFKDINSVLLTFISGFISSLIGIAVSEKAPIMTFIMISIVIRSIHSLLVVYLKKKGISPTSKFYSWLVMMITCFLLVLSNFYNPNFRPAAKLFDRYAFYANEKEREEMNHLRSIHNMFK